MLTEKQHEFIRQLYTNGMSIRAISQSMNIPKSTVGDHVKGVVKLPLALRKNPSKLFKDMSPDQTKKVLKGEEYNVENMQKRGLLKDIHFYLDAYKKGSRFLSHIKSKKKRLKALNSIPLRQLQEICDAPTGYHSRLSMKQWADYYLAGRSGRFLKEAPHKWCKIQDEIFDLWELHQMLMVETFRDLGKTMSAEGVLTHEICEHPDNNYFIMSETQSKAGRRVKHIADALLTNPLIIADYGFLPHTKKYEGRKATWRWHEITVKRHFHQTDPTLIAFSSESTIATGMHFAGGVFDDVWSFKLEQNSQRNKEKWLGWRDGELEGCMENAWELYLLTRKGPTDLYQDLEDRQMHVVVKHPAVLKFPSEWEAVYKEINSRQVFSHIEVYTDDWEISDDGNGRFSIEFFLEKMIKMDSVAWESEYQLNPIASTGRFWSTKDLRYITGYNEFFKDIAHNQKSYEIRGFMDLGFGKSARADFTALTIVATWERKYYFLETYLKRGATEKDMIEIMQKACQTFPALRMIYIEDDLQQTNKVERLKKKVGFVMIKGFSSRQEMARLFREDSARRVNLEGKPLRIWCQLEAIIDANDLYINKYMHNYKEFTDEFKNFPSCKHFDVLDALGNCIGSFMKNAAFFFCISG